MKIGGGHFAPKLGGHFELESGGHFKLELGGQYHWNLHVNEVLPFTLAFMPKIKKVTILNQNTRYLDFCKREYIQNLTTDKFIVSVATYQNDLFSCTIDTKEFMTATSEEATVIVALQGKKIVPYPAQLTKLFCSLPMIGTENFAFPIAINSTKFNPKTERDGIRLSSVDHSNRGLLVSAVEATKILISNLVQENFTDFYNIIKWQRHVTDDNQERNWYSYNIITPLKIFLSKQSLVITKSDDKISFESVKIPYFPREEKSYDCLSEFYELASSFNPEHTPQVSDFNHWYDNIDFTVFSGTKYELKELLIQVRNLRNLVTLGTIIEEPITWLNSLIALVLKVDENLLDQYAIIPNQVGNFLLRKDAIHWDDDINTDLITIYNILTKKDYGELLLHKDFEINTNVLPYEKKKSTTDIAKSIDDAFSEFPESRRTEDEFQRALRLMFKWFVDSGKPDSVLKDLFKWFHNKKPQLFLETFDDINRDKVFAISQSGKLDSLSKLAESNITDEQLKVVTSNINEVVKLSEVLDGVDGGMDLLLQYAELIKEDYNDFKFKKAIGENVEKIFKEALINSGINAEINHNGWSANDFEIKNINNGKSYFIELKSLASNNVSNLKLSIAQSKKAILNPSNYSLSVLVRPDNISQVDEYYIKQNIKSKNNISNLLTEGINDYEKINSIKSSNRLHLTFRDEIRVNVNKESVIENSDSFDQLIEKIKNYIQ